MHILAAEVCTFYLPNRRHYYIAEIARVFDASENTGVVTAFR